MYTELEHRVDRLETLLGEFIVNTNTSLTRLERIMEENTKRAEEDRKRAEEDRRKMAEEDRKRAEEYNRRAEEYTKRAEEYNKRAEEYNRRAEEDRKAMNKKWGELANKMGTLVEDIVAPNIPSLAKRLFGCEDIEFYGVRITKRHSTDRTKIREFDVLAVCDTKVIVNDTKATPRKNYIDDFIAFVKNREFYAYFPEYKGRELIPVFAAMYLTESTIKYLTRHRIYAMMMKDDTMDIVNFEPLNKTRK